MSDDQNKYEDSFINQDKLNELLEEADRLGDDLFDDSDSEDSFVIDQDEIDKLLNADTTTEDETEDDKSDVIDQDEIDKLLNNTSDNDVDDDDLAFISEDDIAKLMKASGTQKTSKPAQGPEPEKDDDLNTVSDEDLSNLLESSSLSGESPDDDNDDGDDEDSLISQDDIDKLLSSDIATDIEDTDNDIIDEEDDDDEALISQEDIDNLLQQAPEEDTSENVNAETEEEQLISQDDIDQLLQPAAPEAEDVDNKPQIENEGPVSEAPSDESIDKPTLDEDRVVNKDEIEKPAPEASEAESPEEMVSQEDIDNLLNAAEEEDEEDEEASNDTIKLVSQKDIDNLLNDDDDEEDPLSVAGTSDKDDDKVILEKTDPESDTTSKKPFYKSKLLVACSGLLFLFIVTGSVYYITSQKKNMTTVTDNTMISETDLSKPEPPEKDVTPQTPMVSKNIITSVLSDFIVPVPSKMEQKAYMYVDMTVDFIDVSSDPVKDYEPFFRNIVYETLKKALVLESKLKINEADLKKMLMDALNDALSEGAVDNINFTSFKLS